MGWLAVLKALSAFLAEIAATVRTRRLLAAGRAEAVAQSLTEAAHALERARAAEGAVRAELDAHPDRLRDDDGFRRD
ncbi:hypothetical protein GCM10011316_29110 [Roseibium aquae]|uniref:Uncharacterized protein n=1 Tax=Roseibium aquae TaxID=1323746 RepID=A0A916TL55_9HYPH|nr:hypothetical protein [Roseibium aquae]GGB55217.1 hypothetical protein GCM10011316_29110 [Roseibium aquae]